MPLLKWQHPKEKGGERKDPPWGFPSPHPGGQDPVVTAVGDKRAWLTVTDMKHPSALGWLCFAVQYLLLAKMPSVFALCLLELS